jgi:hypothetical protein
MIWINGGGRRWNQTVTVTHGKMCDMLENLYNLLRCPIENLEGINDNTINKGGIQWVKKKTRKEQVKRKNRTTHLKIKHNLKKKKRLANNVVHCIVSICATL